jgi:hypothetical protein
MRKTWMKATLGMALLSCAFWAVATGQSNEKSFKANLNGLQEVPSNSTTGTGEFRAQLDADETTLTYQLDYSALEGATTLFAHVHLGQRGVSGGVSFFLCGGGGKPACPATQGTVTGTVTAADVVGPTGQGIAAGEFAEIIAAMQSGAAYANVHTDKHPSGEIRGQIKDARSE